MILVDAVRDDAPVELGEVVVERLDARVRDDDVPVQPAQRRARGRVHQVAHAARREHGVVRADADGALGEDERREHEEARVVRRVDVHDVELPRAQEPPQLHRPAGEDGVQRLGAVAVERQREAHVHELDAVGREHALAAVGGARGVRHAPRHDRDLVPARGEVDRLPVDVLGDAPELRVVIVREDADAQARASGQSPKVAV